MSNGDGEFSLGSLTGARLSLEKEGYEPAALEATPDVYTDAAMQRVVREDDPQLFLRAPGFPGGRFANDVDVRDLGR